MSLKSFSADEDGVVSMSWNHSSSTDDGLSLLDDIWETKLPESKAKRTKAVEDDDQRKRKVSSGVSSSGDHPPPPKRRNADKVVVVGALQRPIMPL